ncbi:matrix metallopeptidase 23bb [Gouania willdenowi]|uniref:matrix metallopeptidase 23bb n=1 Tax=Gouania willdenowi TaxID=441366 RepID=UPI0010556B08|nr:matrix metalloproteinase-23-like [Gouania willdenowi]
MWTVDWLMMDLMMMMVLIIMMMKVTDGQVKIREKRYTINPLGARWDHHDLTYRIVVFPNTLSKDDTRRALRMAFTKWSDVSPLSFTEVTHGNADITIGFYPSNHSDCWASPLHPCFDGLNGELAHAFLPPRAEIHFDNQEFWILGRSRFSWRQGVWLNNLVQVAAHEVGHILGLFHSSDRQALMNPNCTFSGQTELNQDDLRGIRSLYGCLDKRKVCDSWARLGFCEQRKTFMKKNCPQSCDLCYELLDAVVTATPPPNLQVKTVPRGSLLGFRCRNRSLRTNVRWFKDGERLLTVPGYILVTGRILRIVANEFTVGVYTCRSLRRRHTPSANGWLVRLQPLPWQL